MRGGGRQGADCRLHLWAVLAGPCGDAMIKKRIIFQIEGDRSSVLNTREAAEKAIRDRFWASRDKMTRRVSEAEKLIATAMDAEDAELWDVVSALSEAINAIAGYIKARALIEWVEKHEGENLPSDDCDPPEGEDQGCIWSDGI
jgi:hypothetical protein